MNPPCQFRVILSLFNVKHKYKMRVPYYRWIVSFQVLFSRLVKRS